jgi:hypothetical protein
VLTVTPVLGTPDGSEIALFPVLIQPRDVKTVDLESAIGSDSPQPIGAYGSLTLRYRAPSQINLYASAMITGVGHSIACSSTRCRGARILRPRPNLVLGNISGPVPGCPGPYTGQPGIAFSPATTSTPPGHFFFVQLINSDVVKYDSLTCTATSGLDGAYPYQSKIAQPVNDAPFSALPSTYSTSAATSPIAYDTSKPKYRRPPLSMLLR